MDDELIATLKQLFATGQIKEAQRLIIDALERGVPLPSAPTLQEIEHAALAKALGADQHG